jgi:hypothetical protein
MFQWSYHARVANSSTKLTAGIQVRNSANIGLTQALLEHRGENLLDDSKRTNSAAKVVRRISKG